VADHIGYGFTRVRLALGAFALPALLSACTTTQAAKPELAGGRCAYLVPSVCSKLVPGDGVALRYRAATWIGRSIQRYS
jgi:hypothetical protein